MLGLAAGCVGGPEPDDTVTVGGDLHAAPCPPRSLQQHLDPVGLIESDSTEAFDPGPSGGFFADLGTNGRTCNTCHVVEDGWTITPGHARGLPPHDPLFTPNDGSDCPPTSPSQRPQKALSSQLLNFGLIRIQLAIPATAGYSLVSASNPQRCAIAPGSPEAGGQLFLFRRPLPTTNLVFDSTIMWDGRESLQKVTTTAGLQGEAPLLFDLNDQANSATTGHAQGAAIAGTPAQADIVAFETSLTSAQSNLGFQPLDARGANGGAQYLAEVVAPAFAVGVNDPLQPGFSNADFTIYQAWEPTSPTPDRSTHFKRRSGGARRSSTTRPSSSTTSRASTALRPTRSTTRPTRWRARISGADARSATTRPTWGTTRRRWPSTLG